MRRAEGRPIVILFQRRFQLFKLVVPQKHTQKFYHPFVRSHPPSNIRVIAAELSIALFDSHHEMISSFFFEASTFHRSSQRSKRPAPACRILENMLESALESEPLLIKTIVVFLCIC